MMKPYVSKFKESISSSIDEAKEIADNACLYGKIYLGQDLKVLVDVGEVDEYIGDKNPTFGTITRVGVVFSSENSINRSLMSKKFKFIIYIFDNDKIKFASIKNGRYVASNGTWNSPSEMLYDNEFQNSIN